MAARNSTPKSDKHMDDSRKAFAQTHSACGEGLYFQQTNENRNLGCTRKNSRAYRLNANMHAASLLCRACRNPTASCVLLEARRSTTQPLSSTHQRRQCDTPFLAEPLTASQSASAASASARPGMSRCKPAFTRFTFRTSTAFGGADQHGTTEPS
jgi:hypothetical protein